MQTRPEAFSVAVVMRRRPSIANKPWLRETWRVVGVVVNSQWPTASGVKVRSDEVSDDYLWSGLSLRLYKDEVESYYHNLTSERPSLFVVMTTEDAQRMPKPFLVSASFDEAHAYLEGEQDAEAVPMPAEIYAWIEHFVLTHYVPERRIKRQRRDWRDDGN